MPLTRERARAHRGPRLPPARVPINRDSRSDVRESEPKLRNSMEFLVCAFTFSRSESGTSDHRDGTAGAPAAAASPLNPRHCQTSAVAPDSTAPHAPAWTREPPVLSFVHTMHIWPRVRMPHKRRRSERGAKGTSAISRNFFSASSFCSAATLSG